MKKLAGTKTAENLLAAFAGESQARNRYSYYASVAEEEGYVQIKNIFIETAENEKEHGKRFFRLLLAGFEGELPADITITSDYPVNMGNTITNLISAAQGENDEWSRLYPEFARVADSEGFPDVAVAFRNIAKAETNHEIRFKKLAKNLESDQVFQKDSPVRWKCINCGYIHEGEGAPKVCPACLHPKSFFELYLETF